MATVNRRPNRAEPNRLTAVREHSSWTLRHRTESVICAAVTKLLTQRTDDAGLPPVYWSVSGDFQHGTVLDLRLHAHAGADYDTDEAIAVVRRYAEMFGTDPVHARDLSTMITVEASLTIEGLDAVVWCTWWTSSYETPRPELATLDERGRRPSSHP